MNVTGGCFCEYIKYQVEVDENQVIVCHCSSCQRHSGTAFGVVVGIVAGTFELLSGELKSYETTADSGSLRSRTFCPECGTRIYAKTLGEGFEFSGLRMGTVDQRDQLTPKVQIWCRSAQTWALVAGLPTFDRQPDMEEISRLGT